MSIAYERPDFLVEKPLNISMDNSKDEIHRIKKYHVNPVNPVEK